MKKIVLIIVLLIISSPGFARGLRGSQSIPATAETVTANLSSTSITIPANFMGISEENNDLIAGNVSGASGVSYTSLVGMLGTSGTLRIGGGTSDQLTPPALTQALANQVETNLTALGAGWSLIYGLNICADNISSTTTQAGYILNAVPNSNVSFQLGNEQPSGGCWTNTMANYISGWNSFYSSLTTSYPSMRFSGPDLFDGVNTGATSLQNYVSGLTPGESGLVLVTFHWYSGQTNENVAQLLGCTSKTNMDAGFVCSFPPASLTNFAAGKIQITEMNTVSIGGQAGLSNRFMSATYVINAAINASALGYSGFNIHSGCGTTGGLCPSEGSIYNPFVLLPDGNWTPRPLFYGMYLFSQIEGQVTTAYTLSGTGTVGAATTVGKNGNANILVVNNDVGKPVVITPAQSTSWSTATVLRLDPGSGAGCTDANPILGGGVIGESGAWSGAPYAISNGGTVTLQPCGAVLIEIQP